MSKALTRLTLALLLAAICARSAAAQTTLEWIVLSPAGEQFTALIPKEPLRLPQNVRAGELAASGWLYKSRGEGGERYLVWSLNDSENTGARLSNVGYEGWRAAGRMRHLDLVAEAAWEMLVRPESERLAAERDLTGSAVNFLPSLSLEREFELGGRIAREYTLMLEKEGGPVYVCADGARIYVVAALGPQLSAADSKRFVESFAVGAKTPAPPKQPAEAAPVQPAPATGIGPGRGHNIGGTVPPPNPDAPVDYSRPFKQNEVTKKAVLTFKPEPGYTEQARRFNVTGVVRLRAILHSSGEMQNINVVKYLPHGLTEKSIAAAQHIRFQPAQKDGRAVSQYVVLEYNYNVY